MNLWRKLWAFVWSISEYTGIGLGRCVKLRRTLLLTAKGYLPGWLLTRWKRP